MKICKKFADYVSKRKRAGQTVFLIYGGRRSSKSWSISQYLILRCYNSTTSVIVAGMTVPQLHEGIFQDMKNIIYGEPGFAGVFEIVNSPMEIRCRLNNSRIVFSSYDNPEKAKGAACDIIFINEVSSFTQEQWNNITCNAREAIFADWNPVKKFFINDLYSEEDMLKMTFLDNPFLTSQQLTYFQTLKEQAERPGATQFDIYQYKVQYLGEYCGVDGEIFNHSNIRLEETYPPLHHLTIFCDPSALRGADYFACCLGGLDSDNDLHILDTYSIHEGSPDMIVQKLTQWETNYDVRKLYIEINGIIGTTFYEQLQKHHPELHAIPWYSKANKFERITANYYNLCNHTFWYETPNVLEFLEQVYDFSSKCEHDDNIDSANSLWMASHFT